MIPLLFAFLLMIIGSLLFYIKRSGDYKSAVLSNKIESSLELKKTMALGLAIRFNYPRVDKDDGTYEFEKSSDIFLKQLPLEFEEFVAQIFKKKYGGDIYVTRATGDFGIDFEHTRETGLYLGQVKAYRHDLDFKPIAIIHSNMIKQNAVGGYVITTSSFTKAAREYANNLNIQLIDGVQLVDYWLESMDLLVYETNAEYN
ncbi:restriction endonuclease [Peribacillus frigoritolerans]|uniref:restriction endonuclease n=1 Tax=Peribacillus frigoritolerans TaxID=450367 RepID=UPI00105A01A6|nr:restriction endonuclease [Peribacillus frigoritolerans]TDL80875.1 restriction endonuclease [Peribacillus frigoritolerans]